MWVVEKKQSLKLMEMKASLWQIVSTGFGFHKYLVNMEVLTYQEHTCYRSGYK